MSKRTVNPYIFKKLPSMDDIKGYNEEKAELQILIDSIKLSLHSKNDDQYRPKGLLLEGAPGVGKTMFAKAFINTVKLPVYLIDGTAIVSDIQNAIKNINSIFSAAKKQSYSIIFIDEVGRLIPEQGFSGFKSDVSRSILSCLLTNLDGVESCNNVFIIMTANDLSLLDEALIRPGRIDKVISLQAPTFEERKNIIQAYVEKDKLLSKYKMNYSVIAKKTTNLMAATLKTLVAEASIVCARKTKEKTDFNLTYIFLDRILAMNQVMVNGLDELPEKMKERLCYHELGHVIVGFVFQGGWSDVAINPSFNKSETGGVTLSNSSEEISDDDNLGDVLSDKESIRDYLCVLLAGRVAEVVFCKDPSDGCSEDLGRFKAHLLNAMKSGLYGYKYTYLTPSVVFGDMNMDKDTKEFYLKELIHLDKRVTVVLKVFADFIKYVKKDLMDNLIISAEDMEAKFEKFYNKARLKQLEKKLQVEMAKITKGKSKNNDKLKITTRK